MSATEKDGASVDCLFSRQDVKLNNVKFFRGTEKIVDPARFRAEFTASIKRAKDPSAQLSSHPPGCKKGAIDIRNFVDKL